MNIHHYETSGGKDLIFKYIDEALDVLSTRQLRAKLWERRGE